MAVTLASGALVVYTGAVKDPKTKNQIHCCLVRWRRVELRWRAGRLARRTTFVPKVPRVGLG